MDSIIVDMSIDYWKAGHGAALQAFRDHVTIGDAYRGAFLLNVLTNGTTFNVIVGFPNRSFESDRVRVYSRMREDLAYFLDSFGVHTYIISVRGNSDN